MEAQKTYSCQDDPEKEFKSRRISITKYQDQLMKSTTDVKKGRQINRIEKRTLK